MNYKDFSYYWLRLIDDPKRLLKIITSRNARGILLHLPFEPSTLSFLNKTVPVSQNEIVEYQEEYQKAKLFAEFEQDYLRIRNKKILVTQKWHELIYILVRKLKPVTVVETGVFDGLSSFFILLALNNNEKGRLYSIDLPAKRIFMGSTNEMYSTTLPIGKEPGWVVPQKLKNRWKLYIGSSKTYLPKVIKEIKNIDIFIHDSMHTYKNMQWEYEVTWKALKEKGLLCSDDIFTCRAFADFSNQRGKPFVQKSGFGIIVKRD